MFNSTNSTKLAKRKKVNFMIGEDVLVKLQTWVLPGQRSDFVNGAIDDAIVKFCRKKAMEGMDELRKKAKIHMSIKEMIKRKNYGRP